MRQRLEFVAGRRRAWIGVVGNEVAGADLEGVKTRLPRRHVNQPLGDCAGDGMTDGAILARLHLVLKHDREFAAIVLELVRRAHQADRLISFDGAGARIG